MESVQVRALITRTLDELTSIYKFFVTQYENKILVGERPTNDENINSRTTRAVESVNEVSISGGSTDHSVLANPRETPRGVGSRAFK